MKYRVGDKVRIRELGDTSTFWDLLSNYQSLSERQLNSMKKWLGKVMTIRNIDGCFYKMEEDNHENNNKGWYWHEFIIDSLYERSPKGMLEVGMIVKLKDGQLGNVYKFKDNRIYFVTNHSCIPLDYYKENLEHIGYKMREYDVEIVYGLPDIDIKIKNFSTKGRNIIYQRQTVKQMTVKQIEEILGYKIKIISDD